MTSSSSRKISNTLLAVTIAATLLTTTLFTMSINSESVFAQQPPAQPAQPQTTPQQQQQNAPLNFYLKLANNASTAQAAPEAAGNGTKNLVRVEKYLQMLSIRLLKL